MGWNPFKAIGTVFSDVGDAVGDAIEAGAEATGNPFSSDKRKRNKFYMNALTMGMSGATEMVAENVAKPLGKKIAKEAGRGIGNFAQDFSAGMSLVTDPGGTLGMDASSGPAGEATREIYDPRRKSRNRNMSNSLTGQFDTNPSLIG